MPGVSMHSSVVTELQRQMNHELGAAHAYTALAVWCVHQNLKGFARFFHKQSGEEREHAQKFMDHLLDRGVMPELQSLPSPRTAFGNLLEVARHAQSMEQANTTGIHQAYDAAVKAHDLPAQVALHWFINEQVEEENWSDEMVERVEAAGSPIGLIALDRHIERMLADDAHGGAEG